MRRMECSLFVFAAMVALVLAPVARAVELSPGQSTLVPGVAAPSGANLLDSLATPFTLPSATGTLTSKVLSNDASNPYGVDKLTFTYQFTNTSASGSPSGIFQLAVSSFEGALTDVGYVTPVVSGEIAPYIAQRDLAPAGQYVAFSFFNPPIGSGIVAPGMSSAVMVVYTSATGYESSISSLTQALSTNVATLSPVAIPEPASMGLIAIAGLALRRRR